MVAFDRTQLFSFHECHCLIRASDGRTTYYHAVVEAKLVSSYTLVFTLLTEFIENPSQYADKQDCELKAIYWMLSKLKAAFPQTPFCLLFGGLYPNREVLQTCSDNKWKYIITLNDDQLPLVRQEYCALFAITSGNRLARKLPKRRQGKGSIERTTSATRTPRVGYT